MRKLFKRIFEDHSIQPHRDSEMATSNDPISDQIRLNSKVLSNNISNTIGPGNSSKDKFTEEEARLLSLVDASEFDSTSMESVTASFNSLPTAKGLTLNNIADNLTTDTIRTLKSLRSDRQGQAGGKTSKHPTLLQQTPITTSTPDVHNQQSSVGSTSRDTHLFASLTDRELMYRVLDTLGNLNLTIINIKNETTSIKKELDTLKTAFNTKMDKLYNIVKTDAHKMKHMDEAVNQLKILSKDIGDKTSEQLQKTFQSHINTTHRIKKTDPTTPVTVIKKDNVSTANTASRKSVEITKSIT